MNKKRLEEIKAHERNYYDAATPSESMARAHVVIHDDLPDLVAEVERLRRAINGAVIWLDDPFDYDDVCQARGELEAALE